MAEKTRQVILSGRSVIDMTLGEPDFPTPKHICDAAVTAIANQETKYTPINGTIALREAISRKFKRDNGLEFGLGEISVACGGKQVLYQAFLATLRPGDEVVMPTPYWASYADMVTLHAGVLKPITTRVEDGFLLQPEALEAALTERTKWVVLNSPINHVRRIDERHAAAHVVFLVNQRAERTSAEFVNQVAKPHPGPSAGQGARLLFRRDRRGGLALLDQAPSYERRAF